MESIIDAFNDLLPSKESEIEEEEAFGSQQISNQTQGTTAKKAKEKTATRLKPKKAKEKTSAGPEPKKARKKTEGTKSKKAKENTTGTKPKTEKGKTTGMDNEWIEYLPLYKAVESGNWEAVENILNCNSRVLAAKISGNGNTALHVATQAGHVKIVKELVKKMKAEAVDFALQNSKFNTALHDACSGRIIKTAEILVEANPNLPSTKGWTGIIPIVQAAISGDKAMVHYLYPNTPQDALNPDNPNNKRNSVRFLNACIDAEIYDIALKLVLRYENLANSLDTGAGSALNALAQKPTAFESGNQLWFWQQWIYKIICVETPQASTKRAGDIEWADEHPTDPAEKIIKRGKVPPFRHIYEEKLKHKQARKLLVCICKKISDTNPLQFETQNVYGAIVEATRNGIVEFITEIVKLYPDIIWKTDDENKNIFNHAILHRQEKIFGLMYGMSAKKNMLARTLDKEKNTMLHHAALLSHASSKLGRISGAALQVQRELQWFKEVEEFVQPSYRTKKNKEGKTPGALFTEEHKKLVEEGEKWMKDTAQSCTVVAALIITIMFAAALTVPGGYNGETGVPIYLDRNSFLIFIIADALSLSSSSISVLMFLGILTTRDREEDFRKSLPWKLMIGLSALFFSILTMMMTFCITILLVLRPRLSWFSIPAMILASIPVILFILLQFPLLAQIFFSTCGSRLFERRPEKQSIWDSRNYGST